MCLVRGPGGGRGTHRVGAVITREAVSRQWVVPCLLVNQTIEGTSNPTKLSDLNHNKKVF